MSEQYSLLALPGTLRPLLGDRVADQLPKSELAEGAYHFLKLIKQEPMYEALQAVNEVFILDADALIFKKTF